jgi:hypothetical protein
MRSNANLLHFEVNVENDHKMRLQPLDANVLPAVLMNSSGVWTSWQEDATPWMGKSTRIPGLCLFVRRLQKHGPEGGPSAASISKDDPACQRSCFNWPDRMLR